MTREEKIKKRILRSRQRAIKNGNRNRNRKRKYGSGMDCPYDVDINGSYGTCNCGGENYDSCLEDI